MSAHLERCYALSELLTRQERLELTKKLLGDLEPAADIEEIDREWVKEARRRHQEHLDGNAELYDEEQVMREARQASA